MLKRWRRIFFIATAFLALVLASLPLWFPLILRPVLSHFGVRYSTYHRDGYSRLTLGNVQYASNDVSFTAQKVEALIPTVWLWKQYLVPRQQNVFVKAADWQLEITPTPPKNSRYTIATKTTNATSRIRQWIPRATLTNGTVIRQQVRVRVPSAQWDHGLLRADLLLDQSHTATASADFRASPTLDFKIPSLQLEGHLQALVQPPASATSTNALSISGQVVWQGSQVDLSAAFGRNDLWPIRALVEADAFHIVAPRSYLSGYQALDGSFFAEWHDSHFDIDLDATAQTLASNTAPPLSVVIHALGDTNSVRVQTADITSSWLEAHLSQGFAITYSGQMLSRSATFQVNANLNRQPWIPLTGTLKGEAYFQRETGAPPDVFFYVQGSDVAGYGVNAKAFGLNGDLIWPTLTVSSLEVHLADGSLANLGGSLDLEERSISSAYLQFAGRIPRLPVPTGYSYQKFSIDARLQGPWNRPSHSGKISITAFDSPQLVPLQISADWKGEALRFDRIQATLKASEVAKLVIGGSMSVGPKQGTASIDKLDCVLPDRTFALEHSLEFQYTTTQAFTRYSTLLQQFHWRSGDSELSAAAHLEWPSQGHVTASVQKCSPTFFQPFFKQVLPAIQIDTLDSSATWSNGPANFSLNVDMGVPSPTRLNAHSVLPAFSAQIAAAGTPEGITVERFVVRDPAGPIASGTGSIPIAFDPTQPPTFVHFHSADPLKVRLTGQPNPAFWKGLTAQTPFRVANTRFDLAVDGTLAEPNGQAALTADSASFLLSTNSPPLSFSKLSAQFTFAPGKLALTQLDLLAEGQSISGDAELPLPQGWERNLKQTFDWRRATARIRAPRIEMASLAKFATNFISDKGSAAANLAITPPGRIHGVLLVHRAATHSFQTLPPLQDIEAKIQLNGQQIKVDYCNALLGGEPVALFGSADLSRIDPKTHLPTFDMTVRGDNVPLARRADLILRTHFELRCTNLKGGPPIITGDALLQRSFFLSDIKLLVPSQVAKPEDRPPYFSVQRQPFADWRIDVALHGSRFLKVQSPFFSGVVSADFRLTGTLGVPAAVGVATVDNGVIQFPFANLQVTQGEITLPAANPYQPMLFVTANARAYNYDIQMRVTGPADKPDLQFSSTPSLSSEQILLMLTTGQMPLNQSSLSSSQRAGRVAVFFGKSFLSGLGLGTGTEDRLKVHSGESTTEPGIQAYAFEYKLSPNWWIIGEYDSFGAFNIGLRWRVYSR